MRGRWSFSAASVHLYSRQTAPEPFGVIFPFGKPESRWYDDRRKQMIAETSAWLTWAMRHQKSVPRIPTRPVSQGGFGHMLKNSAARSAVQHWWAKAIETVGSITHRDS